LGVIFWWAVSVAGFSMAAFQASGSYEVVAYVFCASLIVPLERFFGLLAKQRYSPQSSQSPPAEQRLEARVLRDGE
jgi:uncharacterized paraquat-inducible protein A